VANVTNCLAKNVISRRVKQIKSSENKKGKKRIKSDTCYSAFYVKWTCGQKHFTISKVAADWHK